MDHIKILKEIKELIETQSPVKIDKIILFGSRVEGNAKRDSDYDILVIVKGLYDWKIGNIIYNLCYEIDLKYNVVTDIKIISVNDLNTIKGKQPFIIKALENGIMV